MTKKHILITGGAGFIGTHLARELVKTHQVTVVDRLKGNLPQVNYLTTNYDNRLVLAQLLPTVDIVYHLAWSTTPASSQGLLQEKKENISPSETLMKLAKKAKVKHFIFMSSAGAVYGKIKPSFKETDTPKPINSYGKAKHMVENLLKDASNQDFKTTVIRATNIIGDDQKFKNSQGVIPAIINCLKENKTFELWGNSTKDYLQVDDLISCLIVVQKQSTPFEIFNIGSGKLLSVTDIIAKLEKKLNKKLKVKIMPSKPHDLEKIEVNLDKIKNYF